MRIRRSQLVIAALTLAAVAPAWRASCAQTAPAENPAGQQVGAGSVEEHRISSTPAPPGRSPWVQTLQTLLALAVVIGLIFLVRWIMRRLGGAGRVSLKSGPVEVLARKSLSPRHHLYLLRMGKRLLLVGAGPEGMSRLAEVTDPAEAAQLLEGGKGPLTGGPDDSKARAGSAIRDASKSVRSQLSGEADQP